MAALHNYKLIFVFLIKSKSHEPNYCNDNNRKWPSHQVNTSTNTGDNIKLKLLSKRFQNEKKKTLKIKIESE